MNDFSLIVEAKKKGSNNNFLIILNYFTCSSKTINEDATGN
jgi:hypothetical protein